MTTIVHDTTEAVCLSAEYNMYLKPIAKMTISVTLPQLKLPGKSISNWEVMERVKAMVVPDQFSALRVSKSTMDFIRFEGEVENKTVVKSLLSRLDGKSIKLSGFTDVLKVRAVENKVDFPTRHDWDSFFRDAKDMNETLPGERPDTIHLEGLPCRWFSQKQSGFPDRPCEEALIAVFEAFGKVRNVDIPMLDPYREEMLDKNFNTFSFGGHLNFEAYVQYHEYCGFTKAMDTMRGMKLMLKGDDGKAVACNIKVTFDTTKHLGESEPPTSPQKERERKKEEKQRKREQKLQEREERRNMKRVRKQQEEEQKKLQMKIAMEERRLLLVQRNLESIRLIAELLARAKHEKREKARQEEERVRREQQEACRRKQQEELLKVELEKERALDLQRREKELREKLLSNMLKKSGEKEQVNSGGSKEAPDPGREDASLLALGQLNGLKTAEGKEKPVSTPSEMSGKGRGTKVSKVAEDVKKTKEERRKEEEKSQYSKERDRSSRRHHSSSSRRRRSRSSSHRRTSRRSDSPRRNRRHSHSHWSRSTSSSRDRSRSSRGRSYSRGRSRRHSHHRHSRDDSRSISRDRSRHGRGYRRRSYSQDRSHSRR
uniref:A kinase (PRKA) anchor protein 17A n=1 Tax=Hippocampus comes TaxID=109280 RepID=A0A3Q2XQN9_HIPCM